MSIKGVTDLTVTSIPVIKIVDRRTMKKDSVAMVVLLIIRIIRRNGVRTMRKNHATRISVRRRWTRKKRTIRIIIIVTIVEGIERAKEMTGIDVEETEKEKGNVVILGTKGLGIDIGRTDRVIIKRRIVRDQGRGQGIVLRRPSEL